MATHTQNFNMSGYAAPPLGKVRIGFIGLGMRGPGAVERIAHIEGVEIASLCDKYPDRVDRMQEMLAPQVYGVVITSSPGPISRTVSPGAGATVATILWAIFGSRRKF